MGRYWNYLDRPDYFVRFVELEGTDWFCSIGESEEAVDRMLEGSAYLDMTYSSDPLLVYEGFEVCGMYLNCDLLTI